MKNSGVTTVEMAMWVIGGVCAAIAYAHTTFTTYREVVPRLDRIEGKIDTFIEHKK